jgi:hypothetical protein
VKHTTNNRGQATVEYIFILAFAILFGFNVISKYTNFFGDSMGSVSHVLSTHLTIGVCDSNCWLKGYENSYTGTP